MTSTTTEAGVARSSTSRAKDAPPVKPTWSELKTAICRDAKMADIECSRTRARELITMLEKAVGYVRVAGRPYRLDQRELNRLHPVLWAVMDDDVVVAVPGSAHEQLNRFFAIGNEIGIVHTRDGANLCVIAIAVEAA